MQQKNLTERKFNPVKSDNLKSPNNLKISKQTLLKKDLNENIQNKKFEEKKNEEPKENKEIIKEKKENKDNKEIKNKEIKEKKEKKIIENIEIEKLKENYDPNLYGFNLYKHVKENLRNKDKLCKDKLTKESLYCLDCRISTCNKCSTFNIHKGHNLIPKYLYYNCDEKIFADTFNSLDSLFEENPDFLNNKILKEELKKKVNDSINGLIKRLTAIKNQKL